MRGPRFGFAVLLSDSHQELAEGCRHLQNEQKGEGCKVRGMYQEARRREGKKLEEFKRELPINVCIIGIVSSWLDGLMNFMRSLGVMHSSTGNSKAVNPMNFSHTSVEPRKKGQDLLHRSLKNAAVHGADVLAVPDKETTKEVGANNLQIFVNLLSLQDFCSTYPSGHGMEGSSIAPKAKAGANNLSYGGSYGSVLARNTYGLNVEITLLENFSSVEGNR